MQPPNGCPKHPDCFTCPFPDCIYTVPSSEYSWQKRHPERARMSAALRAALFRQRRPERAKEIQNRYVQKKAARRHHAVLQ